MPRKRGRAAAVLPVLRGNSKDRKRGAKRLKEIWADIYGFDGKYQVSTWGRIRSASGILSPYRNRKGYEKIDLYKDGVRSKHRVNRLVAETFIPNFNGLPEVNHIDGDKSNNSVTNLEWISGEANRKHDATFERDMLVHADLIRWWREHAVAVAKYHFPEG